MDFSTEQINRLLGVLSHPDEYYRACAVAALGTVGAPGVVESLIEALQDPSHLVQQYAARALGRVGLFAVGSVLSVIQDPPAPGSQKLAEYSLATIRAPETADLLCAALEYAEPEARIGAAISLGHMAVASSLDPLIQASRHPHPGTRLAACQALGQMALPELRAVQAAVALLREDTWELRQAAVQTVGVLAAAVLTRRIEENLGIQDEDLAIEILQPLLPMLRDPVSELRFTAANAMLGLAHPMLNKALMAEYRHAEQFTRVVILEMFGKTGDTSLIPWLHQVANEDGDLQLRLSAAQSLVRLGDERGLTILLRTLNAPNIKIRQIAGIALANVGDPRAVNVLYSSIAEIKAVLSTPENRYIFYRMARALAQVGAAGIPEIAKGLDHFVVEVRRLAAQALIQIGRDATPQLLTLLEVESSRRKRVEIIRVLGEFGEEQIVGPLADIVSSGDRAPFLLQSLFNALVDPGAPERLMAAAALGKTDHTNATPALVLCARYDPDSQVRRQAIQSLAELACPSGALELVESSLYSPMYRATLGITWLVLGIFVLSLLLRWIDARELAPLSGLVIGAAFGLSGGLSARRSVIQALLIGLVGSTVMGGIGMVASARELITPDQLTAWPGLMILVGIPFFAILSRFRSFPLLPRLLGLFFGMVLGFTAAILIAGLFDLLTGSV